MKRHPFKVEQDKPERERGTYLNPEAFGQPAGRGVEWVRYPELMKQIKEQRELTKQISNAGGQQFACGYPAEETDELRQGDQEQQHGNVARPKRLRVAARAHHNQEVGPKVESQPPNQIGQCDNCEQSDGPNSQAPGTHKK